MESLKLKIGNDYPFNEDSRGVVPRGAMAPPDFSRSLPISSKRGGLCPPNNTGTSGFSALPTALDEANPEGPPEKRPKIQVPDKSEWSPLKLPGIPDLGDKNMQFPVKSVKEKFPIEPLAEWSPEGPPEKLTGISDLPNQTLQITVESDADEVLEMFHDELWGARSFMDELELIRKRFRNVGM